MNLTFEGMPWNDVACIISMYIGLGLVVVYAILGMYIIHTGKDPFRRLRKKTSSQKKLSKF